MNNRAGDVRISNFFYSVSPCSNKTGTSDSSSQNKTGSEVSSSSSSSSSSGGGELPKPQLVSVSGVDTDIIGTSLELSYLFFQKFEFDFGGETEALVFENLVATNSAFAMDIVSLVETGSNSPALHLGQGPEQTFTLMLGPNTVSLNVQRSGREWYYETDCEFIEDIPSCANMDFDRSQKTITLNNLELVADDLDAANQATGKLTLSGTVVWTEEDEKPSTMQRSMFIPYVGSPKGVSLAELEGVWDASSEFDSGHQDTSYIHFSDGKAISYDFDQSSSQVGGQCYEKSVSNIVDLSQGVFDIKDENWNVTFQTLIERIANDQISIQYFFEKINATRSTKVVSDFTPLCPDDQDV